MDYTEKSNFSSNNYHSNCLSYVEGIQSTALDALRLKISAVSKKYYSDAFINEMEIKKINKKFLPIINRGTWSRVYAIQKNLEKLLSALYENDSDSKINIINLGAGFDTMYFSIKEDLKFNNFTYIEFDYPEITNKKIEMIKRSKKLSEIIQLDEFETSNMSINITKRINSKSKDYFIIDADITNYEILNEELCRIPNFDFSVPTVIISECLLVYLDKVTTYQIMHNFTTNFKNLIILVYDLIGSEDNFGKEMIFNLMERGIKLSGYLIDADAHIERLKICGFNKVQMSDMLTYYNYNIDHKEKIRIENLEFVDEFEEWNLLQSHACYGYGTKLQENYEYLNLILKI